MYIAVQDNLFIFKMLGLIILFLNHLRFALFFNIQIMANYILFQEIQYPIYIYMYMYINKRLFKLIMINFFGSFYNRNIFIFFR